jgi:prevent-host-death family protein
MALVSASEFKNHLGQFLDRSWTEDISIQKNGREVAVLISKTTYENLKAYEEQFWASEAKKALHEGLLSSEDSLSLLSQMLHTK